MFIVVEHGRAAAQMDAGTGADLLSTINSDQLNWPHSFESRSQLTHG
jgi:hypothetical protein